MVRTKSLAALISERGQMKEGYRSRLVYAARSVELHPKDRNGALEFLKLISVDDQQQTEIMTLGDSLCSDESISEMEALEALRDRIPRDLVIAAVLVPGKLSEHVSYALVSTQHPHSDYEIQMERVCRKMPGQFRSALQNLPPEKRDWFVAHVLDPAACHAVALLEAQ